MWKPYAKSAFNVFMSAPHMLSEIAPPIFYRLSSYVRICWRILSFFSGPHSLLFHLLTSSFYICASPPLKDFLRVAGICCGHHRKLLLQNLWTTDMQFSSRYRETADEGKRGRRKKICPLNKINHHFTFLHSVWALLSKVSRVFFLEAHE